MLRGKAYAIKVDTPHKTYGAVVELANNGGALRTVAHSTERNLDEWLGWTWQDTKKEMPACVGIQVSPAAPCKRAATTPYQLVNLLEATPRPCLQVTPAERQMSPTA